MASKTLFNITSYCCIRLQYKPEIDFICIYLNIYKRNRKLKKSNFDKSKLIIQKLKVNGCAICGYNKCNAALEFHHVNPEDKKHLIGRNLITNYSNKTIMEEMNKCILLCANCHREIHLGECHG